MHVQICFVADMKTHIIAQLMIIVDIFPCASSYNFATWPKWDTNNNWEDIQFPSQYHTHVHLCPSRAPYRGCSLQLLI